MLSALQAGIRVTLNRPRIFGVVTVSFAAEVALRLALVAVHPVLSVLSPPVVAIPLLGATAPAAHDAVRNPSADPALRLRPRLRDRGPSLLLIAVAGHLVALALGTAAFLLVDTPVRAAVYATGRSLSAAVVYVTPLAGVAAGTLLAWSVLSPTVARAAGGDTLRTAVRTSFRALGDRRRTGFALALHAVCVLVGAGVFVTALTATRATYATRSDALGAFLVIAGLAVGAVALLGLFVYPVHVALARERTLPTHAPSVGRVALVALLLVGLVAGASALRVTETRPTGAVATTSLPENATDAYAVALERTAARDHRVVAREGAPGQSLVVTYTLERSTRQYRTTIRGADRAPVGYADSGVVFGLSGFAQSPFALGERDVGDRTTVRALPGYWQVRGDYQITQFVGFGLPEPRTGTWTTVARTNGRWTLELTGGPAVFDALQGGAVPTERYETARVRMHVDADRGVVTGGRAKLNVATGAGVHVRNVTFDVRTGGAVDARRPAALGPLSLGEWAWDLFAY